MTHEAQHLFDNLGSNLDAGIQLWVLRHRPNMKHLAWAKQSSQSWSEFRGQVDISAHVGLGRRRVQTRRSVLHACYESKCETRGVGQRQCKLVPLFKGQCHKLFCFRFLFHESVSPKPLRIPLGPFQIFFWKLAEIFAAQDALLVSLTPVSNKKKRFKCFVWAPLGSSVNIQTNFFLQVHFKV
jgi:hypothetical protein